MSDRELRLRVIAQAGLGVASALAYLWGMVQAAELLAGWFTAYAAIACYRVMSMKKEQA